MPGGERTPPAAARLLLRSATALAAAAAGCASDGVAGPDAAPPDAAPPDAAPPDTARPDAAPPDAAPPDAAGCADDPREDDDTLAAALATAPLYDLDGAVELTGLVACPGDDDVLRGYADCCGDRLGAELRWSAAAGELSLELLAPDGGAWPADDVAAEPGLRRRAETATAAGGSFLVRVRNPGPAVVGYDLTVFARVYGP